MADLKTSFERLNVGESDQQWPQKVSKNSRRLRSLAGFAQQRFNKAVVIPLFDLFWDKQADGKYKYYADPRIFVTGAESEFPNAFEVFGAPESGATALFNHLQGLFPFDDVTDDEVLADLANMSGPDGGFIDFVDIRFRVRKTKEPVIFDLLQTGLDVYEIESRGTIEDLLLKGSNEGAAKAEWIGTGNFSTNIGYTPPSDKYELKSWVRVAGVNDVRSLVSGPYGELINEFWEFPVETIVPASVEMVVTV